MTSIKISDLTTADIKSFARADSFLNELEKTETTQIFGGGLKSDCCYPVKHKDDHCYSSWKKDDCDYEEKEECDYSYKKDCDYTHSWSWKKDC